ncbi:SPOR domain-containing protein [Niallia circulans]|uniref:SPOR domain-containing protein n=1 Tax=Niallia circulans TaxID=1397 RepID=UPI00148F4628|nr:SPOR domain-containing protein [Niallia circulans]QJX63285.1 SPOR domain-containing protein [Niallia circulans]
MNEKPENRKTITIKINGNDRPFQNKDNDDMVERSEPSVFYKDQNSEGKEQDIFKEESAAGQEAEFEESFDWILPASEEIPAKNKEKSIFSFQSSVNKKDKQPFKKGKKEKEGKKKRLPKEVIASIFFAVFFAVILGTSFGFILLNMVSNDQSNTTNGKIAALANDSSDKPKSGQAVSTTESATKPDITTYVLQKGVFSNVERAKSEQQKLTDAGKKSQILPIDKQQFLLVGVVSNLENAKAWQKQVKDTYAKEMVFSGNEVKNVSKEEKEIIEGSSAIYSAILQMVTSVQFDQSIATKDKNKLEKALSLVDEKKNSQVY